MDVSLRFQNIKLLVLEVDGIMTDGRTWQDHKGDWRRKFSVRDTMALRRLRKAGYKIAILNLSHDSDIRDHVQMIGVDYFVEDCVDSGPIIQKILSESGLRFENLFLLSLDQEDLRAFAKVSLVGTVPAARPELKSLVQMITTHEGGDGAVQEICNLINQQGFYSRQQQQAASDR